MRFYLFAFLLAYFQSSALLAFFKSFLFAPNFLLVYLFLNLVEEDKEYGLKKALISGLFLDILQDSVGLNLSGYMLFTVAMNLMRLRFEFPSRTSVIFAYALLSMVEKLWVLTLFRVKYLTELDLPLAIFGLILELGFLSLMLRWRLRKHS